MDKITVEFDYNELLALIVATRDDYARVYDHLKSIEHDSDSYWENLKTAVDKIKKTAVDNIKKARKED